MKKKDLMKYLRDRYKVVDDHGEKAFALVNDGRGTFRLLPDLGGTPQKRQFNCVATMTVPWFSQLTSEIFKEDIVDSLFFYGSYLHTPESGVVTEQDVDDMVDFFVKWFEEMIIDSNVAEYLREHLDRYTSLELDTYTSDVPIGSQRSFIIVNAIKGNVDKLSDYLQSFQRGDNKGFTPLFKAEHFERAVELSKKYKSGELVPPIEF
ncbi:MAG: DUF6990 domain-containing protein [Psychrobium sp.]